MLSRNGGRPVAKPRHGRFKGPAGVGMAPAVVLLGLAVAAAPAQGQGAAGLGGQVVYNPSLRNEATWGVGLRGTLDFLAGRWGLLATADFYMPQCKNLECDLEEGSLSLVWRILSVPLGEVRPEAHLGGGVVAQRSTGKWELEETTELGAVFRVAVNLEGRAFRRFRPFGEGRVQFMGGDFPRQWVAAGGLILSLR